MIISNVDDFMAFTAPVPDTLEPADWPKHLLPFAGDVHTLSSYEESVERGEVTVRVGEETKTFRFPFDSRMLEDFIYGGAL